jgi:hypothetical protein
MPLKSGSQDGALLGNQGGIAVAELLEEARGLLDVGEEEGDSASREFGMDSSYIWFPSILTS